MEVHCQNVLDISLLFKPEVCTYLQRLKLMLASFLSGTTFNSSRLQQTISEFPRPLFQNEVKCSAFDMEIIFHPRVNKTHFHKKDCAPSLILKVRVFGTRKWPIVLIWTWKEHIHSRGQHLCKFMRTKEMFTQDRVPLPQDLFGIPIWPPWRHVNILYNFYSLIQLANFTQI